jgi:hypothetical protein
MWTHLPLALAGKLTLRVLDRLNRPSTGQNLVRSPQLGKGCVGIFVGITRIHATESYAIIRYYGWY